MPWSDFGFNGANGLDMALMPLWHTFHGMFKAIKERYDATISNGTANELFNGVYTNYTDQYYLSQGRRRVYVTPNVIGDVDSLCRGLASSHSNDGLYAYYVESNDVHAVRMDNYDSILDKACNILNSRGFTTTKIPFNFTHALLKHDKHWLIQRKTYLDLFRYALRYMNLGAYLPVYGYQTSQNTGYNSLTESLADLSPVQYAYNSFFGWSVLFYNYYGNHVFSTLIDSLYIEKNAVDNYSALYHFTAPRAGIHYFDEANGEEIHDMYSSLCYPILDMTRTYSITVEGETKDYYKVNLPFSRQDIIDALYRHENQFYEIYLYTSYLCNITDGATIFDCFDQ